MKNCLCILSTSSSKWAVPANGFRSSILYVNLFVENSVDLLNFNATDTNFLMNDALNSEKRKKIFFRHIRE